MLPNFPLQKLLDHHPRAIIAGIVAIFLIGVVAYAMHGQFQRQRFQRTVAALVTDSGSRLQNAFSGPAARSADNAERQLQAVAANLATLRALNGERNPPLAEAADGYVHTVREIVRQRAASLRHHQAVSDGMRELIDHMRSRYVQGPGWTTEALRRKTQLEQDYSLFKLSSSALIRLLESYPDDYAKTAALVNGSALPPPSLAQTSREQELASAAQLAAALEQIRQMPRSP